jgi:hypothetical protein
VPDLTDAELDRLITDLGLTETAPAPDAAERPDPYAGIRALAARQDAQYGHVLGHGLGRPRRPYRRGAA